MVNYWFNWNFGGENIFVVGSFNNWKDNYQMEKNGDTSTIILPLEKREHFYKFIVDGEWKFAPDQNTVADNNGNINNIIDLTEWEDDEELEEEEEEEEDEEEEVKMEDGIGNTCHIMNGYSQDIPQVSDFNLEPPTMPHNLTKNLLDDSINDIPLCNPEFSKDLTKHTKIYLFSQEGKPIICDVLYPSYLSL